MLKVHKIKIDSEVKESLESLPNDSSECLNDILRRLLNKPPRTTPGLLAWRSGGVVLPDGTELKMKFHRKTFKAVIDNGRWLVVVDGTHHDSPSGAAGHIAETNGGHPSINGPLYWSVKRPGDSEWLNLSRLQRQVRLERHRKFSLAARQPQNLNSGFSPSRGSGFC